MLAQNIGEKPAVARSRHAINGIKSGHKAARSSVGSSLVWRKVVVEHGVMAHVGGVIFAPCFHGTIQSKVFYTGHYGVGSTQISALIALNHGFCQDRCEVRVFTIAFRHTTPTGITADVDHGRERPTNAIGGGFSGCKMCRCAHSSRVPRHREGQRNGEYSLVTVNNIHTKYQRDVQTTVFYGYLLQLANALYAFEVKESTYFSAGNLGSNIAAFGLSGGDIACYGKIELPDFLTQCHLIHQVVYKQIHLRIGLRVSHRGKKQHGSQSCTDKSSFDFHESFKLSLFLIPLWARGTYADVWPGLLLLVLLYILW